MAQLVVQELLPDRPNARIVFLRGATGVVPYLRGLAYEEFLERRLVGMEHRAVMRDVLGFHRCDFGIQVPCDGVGEYRADIHVVVVRLVLAAGKRKRMELRRQQGIGAIWLEQVMLR